MGCASSKSKQSKCRHCEMPYSPVARRSFSMNVHHPPVKKGDTYHVVALTSSTLGSIKLDSPPIHKVGEKKCVDDFEYDSDEKRKNLDVGIDRKEEFAMGMIEAKAWSKMIDEKITRVAPRTPIRTPPGEPETINVNDLMEGLEGTSPLRVGEHLRSFSFHVSADSIPDLVDSPRVKPQEGRLGSPNKQTWFDVSEKENALSNGNLVSKAVVSEFDPEVISTFRKALEELSPTNPFYLKPRDNDQQQQVYENGLLDEENVILEKKWNGICTNEPPEERKIDGEFKEEKVVYGVVANDVYAHVNGLVEKKLDIDIVSENGYGHTKELDNGIVHENGYAHTNGYLEKETSEEKIINEVMVENGHVLHKAKERVVLYFTSLRGVRKTYEDCCYVRLILKGVGVRVDERDVSMHSGFKEELKQLLGEGQKGGLPKVFVGEKFIGGVEEVRRMHEEGKLEKLLKDCEMVKDDSGNLNDVCEACGDIRFLPCETCSGSCKIYYECDEDDNEEYEEDEYGFQRCPDCNENGLVRCQICCY